MAKPGKKKKSCDKYRNEGRKDRNKQIKKEREEKRLAKLKERHEAGKTGGSGKRREKHLPLAEWTSTMRKLDNELQRERLEEKKRAETTKARHNKKAYKAEAQDNQADATANEAD